MRTPTLQTLKEKLTELSFVPVLVVLSNRDAHDIAKRTAARVVVLHVRRAEDCLAVFGIERDQVPLGKRPAHDLPL